MSLNIASRHRCVPALLLCAGVALPLALVHAATAPPPVAHSAAPFRAGGSVTGETPNLPTVDDAAAVAGASLSADRLVREVWQSNRGIDAMRAAAAAANARIESAGALDDPMVSYAAAPNTAGGPRQGRNQNVQVSQQLPWPGTLELRTRMASAEAESAEQQVADLRWRLAANARADFAQWYYVHQAMAINTSNIALLKRLRAVANAAYASGQSPEQDVLQAEVELTRLDNQTLTLKRMQRTVQAKINALQNRDPDAAVPAPADLPAQRPLPTYAALRDAALAHYPMLRSLDARVSASRNGVDLAHKANYPKLKLMAGYNSLWDMPAKRLVIGVGFSIPFGRNHRGQVREADARLDESEAKLADARTQLLSDLDQTRETAAQATATIDLYRKKLLPLTRLNLQAAEADYSGGNGDFLKLITAEQQHLMAKLELVRARADFYTQLSSLDYQTGGALQSSSISATAQDATR